MSTPPVTLMVTRRVAEGRYQDLMSWLHEGEQLATDFTGYLGSGVLAPPPQGDEFQIIFRFTNEQTMQAWEHSASRNAWLARGNGLFKQPQELRASGLDGWFGTNPVQRPPRWKQAVAIWLAFFPVSLLFNLVFGHWLSALDLVPRILLSTLGLTPLMVYFFIPLSTRLLAGTGSMHQRDAQARRVRATQPSSGMLGVIQANLQKLTAPTMNSPILVTGASQRVGLALALNLAQAGHTVVSASRSKNPQAEHPNIVQFQADLCREDDRLALIEHLQSNYDGLRAIIHNASMWLDDDLPNLNTMFKLHVEAPYHLNLALGEQLLKVNKADIIHICDETSSRGSKSHIGYAATKAALQNMVLSFAEKYAPVVRVNAILPGLLILKENSDEAYRQQTLKKALLEFEPGAQPLIDAVKFLLESQYSTGSNVVINGGRHLKNRIAVD